LSDTSTPRFLQGRFAFKGEGFEALTDIDDMPSLTVPPGATLQAVYFRGGNSSDELVTVALLRDGDPVRYLPIGARNGTHVALRLVEDFLEGAELTLKLSAPAGASGTVVIDLGLVEI